jgi:hypothetical protein
MAKRAIMGHAINTHCSCTVGVARPVAGALPYRPTTQAFRHQLSMRCPRYRSPTIAKITLSMIHVQSRFVQWSRSGMPTNFCTSQRIRSSKVTTSRNTQAFVVRARGSLFDLRAWFSAPPTTLIYIVACCTELPYVSQCNTHKPNAFAAIPLAIQGS